MQSNRILEAALSETRGRARPTALSVQHSLGWGPALLYGECTLSMPEAWVQSLVSDEMKPNTSLSPRFAWYPFHVAVWLLPIVPPLEPTHPFGDDKIPY